MRAKKMARQEKKNKNDIDGYKSDNNSFLNLTCEIK